MVNTVNSILCFILAYVVVSLLEIVIAILRIKLFTMKQLDEDLFNDTYKKISFWRPIIAFVTFSILGYAYNSSLIKYSVINKNWTRKLQNCFFLMAETEFCKTYFGIVRKKTLFFIAEK